MVHCSPDPLPTFAPIPSSDIEHHMDHLLEDQPRNIDVHQQGFTQDGMKLVTQLTLLCLTFLMVPSNQDPEGLPFYSYFSHQITAIWWFQCCDLILAKSMKEGLGTNFPYTWASGQLSLSSPWQICSKPKYRDDSWPGFLLILHPTPPSAPSFLKV